MNPATELVIVSTCTCIYTLYSGKLSWGANFRGFRWPIYYRENKDHKNFNYSGIQINEWGVV